MEAGELGERLQEAGYADGWITSEEGIRGPVAVRPPENRPALSPNAAVTLEIQSENGGGLARITLPNPRVAPASIVRISAHDPQSLLTFDNLAYRGTIELVENSRGKLNVVNILDLDDYLKGVVPNEMPPSKFDAIEALKAQAVAARTYALKNEGRFRREGYQLCATIACQVYRGADSERPLSSEAVEATRGIVIEYHGELIDSLYTSTCGGHTEDAKNIFRTMDAPYLRSASCPPENAPEVDPRLVEVSGYHLKWTVRVTRADLEKILRKTLPLDELLDLEPVEYGISSRVIELKVKGRKRDFTLRGLEVKSALGLKDSLFILDRDRDRRGRIEAFVFIGRGWGHGVGLCQTGSYGLAREGLDFESILKTYYYNVDVVRENIREN
jgi:stage II sporulation protein D